MWLSSAASYLIFATLAVLGAVLVSSGLNKFLRRDSERLEKSLGEATAQLEKHRRDADSALAASRTANEAYRQMSTLSGEERLTGIDSLGKVNLAQLSPLERQAVTDRAELLRREVGQAALERGKVAFRKNDMKSAISELTRFMSLSPSKQESLEASYYLGVAYNRTHRHEQAIPLLSRFVADDRKAKTRDHAQLLLAQSYEQSGKLDQALATIRDALATYPNSDLAPQMRVRLGAFKRAMNIKGDPANTPEPAPLVAAEPAAGH
jgi:tetratricopeptide (TPR) repeat protein